MLDQYGNIEPVLIADGYSISAKILMNIGGGSTTAMAKTAGLGAIEFASVLERLQPHLVVVRADRYEILPLAMTASYMNIPVAHIEGGDVTGTIDEHVRHAITKIAHIHFATSEEARKRIIRMGEDPKFVWNFGAPEIEFVARNNYKADQNLINYLGVGDSVDIKKPFVMVMQHPVTTEYEQAQAQVEETLYAVYESGIPAIWFWPNIDAGTDQVSKGIRMFREAYQPKHIRFIKYLPAEQFIGLLKRASVLIGNSSAGLKEASFLGVPVVNIGTRQGGRYKGRHVLSVPHDRKHIKKAIEKQLTAGRYKRDSYFHKPNSSKNIAKILASVPLYRQKHFHD